MRTRLAAAALAVLLLTGADGGPAFECAPEVAAVGEQVTCTAGPFDAGAEAVITINVDGTDTTRSTFQVDQSGQVTRTYVEEAAREGSSFTLTLETTADGAPVTLQAGYRVSGTRPDPTSTPPREGPSPTASPSLSPAASDGSDWLEDPLGILVVAAVAAVALLAIAAVIAEIRRKRENG